MILTQEERDKFATYLEEHAASNEGLSEQSLKLGKAGEMIGARMKIEAFAARLIARMLRATESSTL